MSPAPVPTADLFATAPGKSATLDETWEFLAAGAGYIMHLSEGSSGVRGQAAGSGGPGLTFAGYTSLYTTVYNYCTSNKMHGRLEGNRTGANLVGADLYGKLEVYLTTYLEPVLQRGLSHTPLSKFLAADVAFLRFYASAWDAYTTGANYLNRLFAYLNRYWVKRERDEGKKNILPVYTLALAQWHAHLFTPLQDALASAVLRVIVAQRDGAEVDGSEALLKRVVNSFVSLGLDTANLNTECLDVYRGAFEGAFIDASEAYYAAESNRFLASGSVPEYLVRVETRLREEDERVTRYLHEKTRKDLITRCESVLLRAHAPKLWEAFLGLLADDKDDDLQRMYALLARIPDGLEPLRKKFEAYVKSAGCAAVDTLVAGKDGEEVDPKAYTDALLSVHTRNAAIVQRSFRAEAGFAAALDKACREFVNRNAATGSSASKSPELLAKYTDSLLRKSNKAEEEDVEGALARVMILFKYLEDKDVFQTFYSTKLSKRLIHGASASDEAEAGMIAKLKEACGFEYTNKLQRMFTDMSLSKDLTDAFKDRSTAHEQDAGFSVLVLGTNFWPFTPPPQDLLLPPELLGTYERFTRYYQTKHSGRKLTWMYNYSKNELRTNYTTGQKYILMTSTYQATVLLQYNRTDTLSFKELEAATGITGPGILSQVLNILVKARVLVCDDPDAEDGQYDLNPGFKSKKIRINLNQVIRASSDKAGAQSEASEVMKTVDEDRKYVIQATIVRIMKARKTLKNQALIQEVIAQISTRFAPKIPDIKKAIETLLEKEYIERVEGSKDVWAYVA
ncbi:unnamed protein product [Mycena citricolor]|uniref:Cullin family profile domain-containing protein n=1 Tax=Mycena citricolor TaxID=2018698 RepID=A0AAD2HWT6_9AGAR|nr:unnamed protein product [Mycena citricolor]